MDGGCDDEEPGSASAVESTVWAAIRRLVAEVFRKDVFRMATTLPQDILAVALAARGVLDLSLPQNADPAATLRALRSLDTTDCPVDLHVFHAELDAVMMEEYDENPEVVHVGTTAAAEAKDDVEHRQKVLDSLADVAQQVVGGPSDLPGSAGAPLDVDQQGDDNPELDAMVDVEEDVVGEPTGVPGSASTCPDADRPIRGRQVKYPRVDPPEVEDEPGQADRVRAPVSRGRPRVKRVCRPVL